MIGGLFVPISKELQKLLVFSDVKTKRFVENYANAESSITRLSGSAIIQHHLLNDIYPKNQIGQELFFSLYTDMSVKDVLASIFNRNASCDEGFKCRWSPESILPFVEFAREMMIINNSRRQRGKYNEAEQPYLISQLKTLSNILENKDKEDKLAMLGNTIKHFNDCIQLTNKNLEEIKLLTYIDIIKDNWFVLKDSTYTYRALYAILQTDYEWIVYPEEQYKLGELIRKHSQAWDS